MEGVPKERRWWWNVDPTALPKVMTKFSPGGGITDCIYELMSEDELHICSSAQNRPRPTDFTFNHGSGRALAIWRRVKDKW
jgi:hypothetical protein